MIHYAQEIRAYALLYTCMLAGLYFGELVARDNPRRARVGLLVCTCLMSYAHYTGLLIAVALWVYTWLRGGGVWRTGVLAAAWAALAMPMVMLGFSHASDKAAGGYWIHPLDGTQAVELLTAWTGHQAIDIWQSAGSAAGRSWAALVLSALLAAGIGLALITAPARREVGQRWAAGAMLAAGAAHAILITLISLAVVPIALERTTFPAFIPLIGLMALSAAPAARSWLRWVGTAACVAVAAVWTVAWPARVYASPERRPAEQTLFSAVAQHFRPGDVVAVFPSELQASAGYFLRHSATADQIHTTDVSRLRDAEDGLHLRAIPRKPDSAWFVSLRAAIVEMREQRPGQHGVWVVDLGIRSTGDADIHRLREWLESEYAPAFSISCGDRWTLAARRYELVGAATEGTD
jgi:hypothetical protein